MGMMREYNEYLSPAPLGSAPAIGQLVANSRMNTPDICGRFAPDGFVMDVMELIIPAQRQPAHGTATALEAVARPSELRPMGVAHTNGLAIGGAMAALHSSKSPCG